MTNTISRRAFIGLASSASLASLAFVAGCSSASSSASGQAGQAASGSAQSSGAQSSSAQGAQSTPGAKLHIGTLATEDLLPLWVAQSEGLFAENNLDIEIVPFQSATELIAGVGSGAVDLAMTDIMVTASMFASDIDVSMCWVTLGTSADQGRFGIMVGSESTLETLTDLADVPIGVGSNTILEYVMDKLLENAGVTPEHIVVEEIQKLPVRYQAMASGEVAAAALPGTLLALGEASGCKLIADDTTGDNLSQSVMIARAQILSDEAAKRSIEQLEDVWDVAVGLLNANPEQYRDVLIENANLPAEIADTYPISSYPRVQLPTNDMVNPVLSWMEEKGYLTQQLSYDESTGAFAKK